MRRYLTETEQRKLLKTARLVNELLAQRDFHWMAALILTGMRIQEFSRLTAPQVRQALTCGWLVSLREHCKGKSHTNEYLVTHPLRLHLQALLKISDELARGMEAKPGEPALVFPVLDGVPQQDDEPMQADPDALQPLVWGRDVGGQAGHLSVRSYEARLKEWAVAADLDPRISPHWLRHTRGMNIVTRTRGKDGLRVAKLALNHQSIRSTGIYTQMSREAYEAEIRLVDGGRVPRRVARQMAAQAVQ